MVQLLVGGLLAADPSGQRDLLPRVAKRPVGTHQEEEQDREYLLFDGNKLLQQGVPHQQDDLFVVDDPPQPEVLAEPPQQQQQAPTPAPPPPPCPNHKPRHPISPLRLKISQSGNGRRGYTTRWSGSRRWSSTTRHY
ncbi:MAG: hypothetical protein ACKPKO_14065, partial [Candidatus Fonsibacter sp.]